jgi:parallel beta-helix repeat protein
MVSNLTLTGEETFVSVIGAEPTLEGLLFDRVGTSFGGDEACHALYGPGSCNPVAVHLDATRAVLRGNTFLGSGEIGVHGGAAPVIEDNEMVEGSHVYLESIGDGTIVRGNTIRDVEHAGIAIYTTGRPLIEGNTISGAGGAAIEVGLQLAPGIAPTIRGNTLRGNATAIEVASGAEPTIEDNDFIDNRSGIVVAGSDAIIAGNRFDGNPSAIFVMRGAPTIADNVIRNGKVGIGLGSEDATPVLSGNTICDNETNLNLTFGATMPEIAGNDICADEAATTAPGEQP